MKRLFTLNLKPFSINALHYANVRHGKTQAAKEWGYKIFHQLDNNKDLGNFKDLRDHYDPKKHFYRVELEFLTPYAKLFTKDGRLKTPDLSNIEKPLIDMIFLPEHFRVSPPYGLKNLNIDDKYIGELTSTKKASSDEEYYIKILIEIKDLDLIK